MGISYEHLTVFGRLRKISRYGPVSMFFALWRQWKDLMTIEQVAEKVKFFFRCASPENLVLSPVLILFRSKALVLQFFVRCRPLEN